MESEQLPTQGKIFEDDLSDGARPFGDLVMDDSGNLSGTASVGAGGFGWRKGLPFRRPTTHSTTLPSHNPLDVTKECVGEASQGS